MQLECEYLSAFGVLQLGIEAYTRVYRKIWYNNYWCVKNQRFDNTKATQVIWSFECGNRWVNEDMGRVIEACIKEYIIYIYDLLYTWL